MKRITLKKYLANALKTIGEKIIGRVEFDLYLDEKGYVNDAGNQNINITIVCVK